MRVPSADSSARTGRPGSDPAEAWERFAQTDPEFYVAHRWVGDQFYAHGAEIVEAALAWADPRGRERALDLGCGLGRMTRALDDRFTRVIGCDLSATMLAQAGRRLSDRAITWSPITNGRLPCETDSCDFVFCYDVLQHIPNPETIRTYLHETRRVLAPEGRAVLHFDTQPRPAVRTLIYHLPDAMLPRARRRFARRYPLRSHEPRTMAEDAGLRVLDERHSDTPFHHLALTAEP